MRFVLVPATAALQDTHTHTLLHKWNGGKIPLHLLDWLLMTHAVILKEIQKSSESFVLSVFWNIPEQRSRGGGLADSYVKVVRWLNLNSRKLSRKKSMLKCYYKHINTKCSHTEKKPFKRDQPCLCLWCWNLRAFLFPVTGPTCTRAHAQSVSFSVTRPSVAPLHYLWLFLCDCFVLCFFFFCFLQAGVSAWAQPTSSTAGECLWWCVRSRVCLRW